MTSENDQQAYFKYMRSLSHDLRTPLTSALGYALMIEECLEDDEPEEILDCANNIQIAIHCMVDMLDKTSRLAHIGSGNIQAHPAPLNFRLFFDIVMKELGKRLEGRTLSIMNTVDPDLSIEADLDMMKQVFVEVLENAVLYSPPNSECIISYDEDTFVFQDKGRGMDDEAIEKALTPFGQSQDAKSLGAGCGLGINIAKGLIETHKGQFLIESSVGFGTSIKICLQQSDNP